MRPLARLAVFPSLLLAAPLFAAPSDRECPAGEESPLRPVEGAVAAALRSGTGTFRGHRFAHAILSEVETWAADSAITRERILTEAIGVDDRGDNNGYVRKGEIFTAAITLRGYGAVQELDCTAGNSYHRLDSLPRPLTREQLLARARAYDAERGCPGRTYTVGAKAARAHRKFVTKDDSFLSNMEGCEEDVRPHRDRLLEIVEDPTNLQVLHSVQAHDSEDDPVHCNYYDFFVMRADGMLIQLDFDYSD